MAKNLWISPSMVHNIIQNRRRCIKNRPRISSFKKIQYNKIWQSRPRSSEKDKTCYKMNVTICYFFSNVFLCLLWGNLSIYYVIKCNNKSLECKCTPYIQPASPSIAANHSGIYYDTISRQSVYSCASSICIFSVVLVWHECMQHGKNKLWFSQIQPCLSLINLCSFRRPVLCWAGHQFYKIRWTLHLPAGDAGPAACLLTTLGWIPIHQVG